MQDKKRADVKNILASVAEYLKVNKIRGLAEYLGIPETTMYAWIKRGNIGNTGKILNKVPNLNINWLETGEGPMIDESKKHLVPLSDAGERKQQKLLSQEREGESGVAAREAEEDWSVSEMLVMTSVVLESKTKYRSVLAENVKALYSAVQREEEMKTINEKLEAMAAENKEMAKRMARMEEMLLSLGAELPEKRDKKAM